MIETKIDKISTACDTFKKVYHTRKQKFKKLDEWLEKESNEFYDETKNKKLSYLKYSYGQIVKIDFGVNIGTELSHTHFAIVLNSDDTIRTDNITVLPLTSKKGYKRINLGETIKHIKTSTKYQTNTFGMITQIKTVSKKRILLNDRKYICDKETMEKINSALADYLSIKLK